MKPNLGKLVPVDVREVWKHEAHDFTKWLLDNAEYLGAALGLDLELTEAEHKVGEFSLDLIGKDGSGRTVIVENQLGQSDHDHLGKLLTYAGGTDPAVIVWVAPKFRENHRAAIDWLNVRTDEDTSLFAVEVSAVKIDNSKPAALFRLIAQPNSWSKQVHAEKVAALSGKSAAYSVFWSELLTRLRAAHPEWTSASTGPSQNWIMLPSGKSGVGFNLLFTRNGPRVELYLDLGSKTLTEAEFAKLFARKDALDAAFGQALTYDNVPDRRASRIHVDRPDGGDVRETDAHPAYLDWFLETFERFRPAVQEIRQLAEADA